MLGVLHLLLSGAVLLHGNIKNGFEDIRNEKEHRIDDLNCYVDHNGATRDIKTNHPVSITKNNKNGDVVIRDYKTGKVNDISQKVRESEYYKLKEHPPKGVTVALWSREPDEARFRHTSLRGDRYKDLKDGRLYVKRYLNHIEYYVDIETLEIVRRTDMYFTDRKDLLSPNHRIQDASTIKEVWSKLGGLTREQMISKLDNSEVVFNRIIPKDTTRVF